MTKYYLKPTYGGRKIIRKIHEGYEDNPNWESYNNIIHACTNIILQTATKGRSIGERESRSLNSDSKFVELRQDVLDKMEAYFYSTKNLLSYITERARKDGELYLAKEAEVALNKDFTPTW